METSPLEWVLVFLVVVVPVLGLTARLALKPIVDAILRLQEAFLHADTHALQERVVRLERHLDEVHDELAKLSELSAFHDSVLTARPEAGAKSISSRRES